MRLRLVNVSTNLGLKKEILRKKKNGVFCTCKIHGPLDKPTQVHVGGIMKSGNTQYRCRECALNHQKKYYKKNSEKIIEKRLKIFHDKNEEELKKINEKRMRKINKNREKHRHYARARQAIRKNGDYSEMHVYEKKYGKLRKYKTRKTTDE